LQSTQRITVGGGCFWCVEAVFTRVAGVVKTTCGYAGGTTVNPIYEDVCSGATGHAEVVQIEFDPDAIPLARILDRFFTTHDPTTLNRQGNDRGTQYRSIILVTDEEQRSEATAAESRAQQALSRPIVTEIVDLKHFFPAEEYHQRYFEKNPGAGYCRVVIAPKLKKLGISTSVVD
jgi:peptide-methionine (S)-S-oxide reductase